MSLTTPRGQRDHLDDLVDLAAESSGAARDAVRSLVDILLATPPSGTPPRRGRSGLNSGGAPLELCFSAFPDACRLRFVADPASAVDDPLERRRAGLQALGQACELTRSQALRELCERTLATVVGADPVELTRYVEGVLWLGAGIGMPGLALYADATKVEADLAWRRAGEWFAGALARPDAALGALERLASVATLMACGLEGSEPQNARAKLFFRLDRPLSLAELGVPRFEDAALVEFLGRMVAGGRALPVKAFVFSTSFLVATGAPFDAKIDVCAHCLEYGADEWQARLASATAAFGLTPLDVHGLLEARRAEAAFVGLNSNPMGARLDFFVKPARWYGDD